MSSATATPERVAASEGPQLIAPTGGMPVDGSAVTFSWADVAGALNYRLQVAADAGFEQVVCTLEAGLTTLFTLLEMLPQDGSAFYWRVQAQAASGWQPWSRAGHFKARTDQHEIAFRAEQESTTKRQPAAAQTGTSSETTPEPELYQVGRTSKGTMALVLAVMLVTFAAIFAYMAYVVTAAQ